jgi:hypothetical protein
MELIEMKRDQVQKSYASADADNRVRYLQGNPKATSEYIYDNQREDAMNILGEFYKNDCRVVSVQKKTKVGADGLMLEIVRLMSTHPDPEFMVDIDNTMIMTGMSNVSWEKDMRDKAPTCIQNSIYHHGKLKKAELSDMKNGLVIIDEIDSGDKEFQVLHQVLRDAGVLDIEHMIRNNNRFVFISATMTKQLYALYRWGDHHKLITMTIPEGYIGHAEFLEKGIIEEFYPLNKNSNSERWLQEDILNYYGTDYRVHIARVTNKTVSYLQSACFNKGIEFHNHTTDDRLTENQIKSIFSSPQTRHIVLAVKGFFRRANLIPNAWKLRIGATHELYTATIDDSVQIQGLPGRMTGYWKEDIESGHKTGPHRTSIRSVERYESNYLDPFGNSNYRTNGFIKRNGRVTESVITFIDPKHIHNLTPGESAGRTRVPNPEEYRIYDSEDTLKEVCRVLGYQYRRPTRMDENGFILTSLNTTSSVAKLQDAVMKVPSAYGMQNGIRVYRTYYPCYADINDSSSLRYVVIIRPGTDPTKVAVSDSLYPSIPFEM